jgi:two-component system, sensor histidine kinase
MNNNIEKFFTNKIQSIQIQKDGTVLNSDNKLVPISEHKNIKEIHSFFEIIDAILDEEDQDFYFNTVQLDFFSKTLVVDVIINSGNKNLTPLILIFDQSEHYKDLQAITQQRNEIFIKNFFEGQKLIRNEEEKTLKNIFLAEISNELRTPISSVTALINLFQKGSLSFEQLGLINTISLSMNHLNRLVNDVFDLSKSELGMLNVVSKPFSIIDVVNAIKSLFANKFIDKKIDFEVLISDRIPDVIIGDQDRLQQILTNVIENACNFTKNGRVTLNIEIDNLTSNKVGLNFIVHDTGVGFTETEIKSLNESLSKTFSQKMAGVGMGLQVVKNIVKLLHGTAVIDSEYGVGTTFKVYLKFDLNIKKIPQLPVKGVFKKIEITKKRHVLIIDDNDINQLVIMKLLVDHGGFYMDIAKNAQMAIDMLAKENYDLILIDVEKPIVNKLQPIIEIRQSLTKSIAKTPIIVLTSEKDIEQMKHIKKLKINKYLVKPYIVNDLFLVIYEALKLK